MKLPGAAYWRQSGRHPLPQRHDAVGLVVGKGPEQDLRETLNTVTDAAMLIARMPTTVITKPDCSATVSSRDASRR